MEQIPPDLDGVGARRRATIAEIARAADVSRQTVSNVLNAPQRVREETRRRVEQVIADTGYRPLKSAQSLRTRRSNLLAVGFQSPGAEPSPVLDVFLHALSTSARTLGYQILLLTAGSDGAEIEAYTEAVVDYAVDGIVLTGTHTHDERIGWLRRQQLPFVTFGRPWGALGGHSWVDVDGAAGTRAATEHLATAGHTRIAFLGWPAGSGSGDDRLQGWEQACGRAGLPTRGLLRRCANTIEDGRKTCAAVLDQPRPPTAIVCVSDALAVGAWLEMRDRGLVPGRDVALIGFDDSTTASVIGLSSVAQPLPAVADACLDALRGQLGPGGPSTDRWRQVLLQPELVLRESG